MEKSLYSLMLLDDVVAELDKIALRRGTNRSNLVNQILAEYVSYTTPEKRIDNIFRSAEQLLADAEGLIPMLRSRQLAMSLKSSLEYKYRPTIKYVVQLYRRPEQSQGELIVNYRTQSAELQRAMEEFFLRWQQIEQRVLAGRYEEGAIAYRLSDGRFVRSLAVPLGRRCTSEQLGAAISTYLKAFDALLKAWLAGRIDAAGLAQTYENYFKQGVFQI